MFPEYKKDGSQLYGELICSTAEAPGGDGVADLRPSALRNCGLRTTSEIETLENKSKNMDAKVQTHIYLPADSDPSEDEQFRLLIFSANC